MAAMNGDIDGAAAAMHAMPGLLDDAEYLVAGGELRALVPELEIRAAQRGARNPHQHLARRRHRESATRSIVIRSLP